MSLRQLCAVALLLSAGALAGARAGAAPPAAPEAAGAPGSAGAPGFAGVPGPAGVQGTAALVDGVAKRWFKAQWSTYRARFVSGDGRVVDNANGGVSHSEGQGYGLLLAATAEDQDGFALVWGWTKQHLQVRGDALFAWKWDPKRQAVADRNTASDGDILIAWALAKAAQRFGRADYGDAARRIVEGVKAAAVRPSRFGPVLMPGATGFGAGEQPDGPVVNLSYWVFPALSDFDALYPGQGWDALRRNGLKLLDASRFGPSGLPVDWVALGGGKPAPARNFKPTFGYDAIRIPLYLAWDRDAPAEALARFAEIPAAAAPHVVEVVSGTVGQEMGGAGYRTVLALARCAARRDTIPPELMMTPDALYYPETLRLLSLSVVQDRFPSCL